MLQTASTSKWSENLRTYKHVTKENYWIYQFHIEKVNGRIFAMIYKNKSRPWAFVCIFLVK